MLAQIEIKESTYQKNCRLIRESQEQALTTQGLTNCENWGKIDLSGERVFCNRTNDFVHYPTCRHCSPETMKEQARSGKTMTYTKKQVNDILGFKGIMGLEQIDVFNLTGCFFIGESSNMHVWESRNFLYADTKLPISIKDSQHCKSDADVKVQFQESLLKAISERFFKKA